jgi:hypothetical protein
MTETVILHGDIADLLQGDRARFCRVMSPALQVTRLREALPGAAAVTRAKGPSARGMDNARRLGLCGLSSLKVYQWRALALRASILW